MATRKGGSSTKNKGQASAIAPASVDERIGALEKMVDLLLAASLRGRLLPADRKVIKDYLEDKAQDRRLRAKKQSYSGPVCPVCRLPIKDEDAERCPNCSALLVDIKKKSTSE